MSINVPPQTAERVKLVDREKFAEDIVWYKKLAVRYLILQLTQISSNIRNYAQQFSRYEMASND